MKLCSQSHSSSHSSCDGCDCPVRPQTFVMGVQGRDEGWDDLRDAPIEALEGEALDTVDRDDEADDAGQVSRVPRGLPAPYEPSALERARHNLTHYPYKSWCEHCVKARRPNTAHRTSPTASDRTVPIFVSDYCFLRDALDDDIVTCFVGKIYPDRNMYAAVVDEKGAGDERAIKSLAEFFRETGLKKIVMKQDQEASLRSFVEAAVKLVGGTIVDNDEAVEETLSRVIPENSAVGESASNGKAERSVQSLEDQVRTLKLALESRIESRIESTHPIMRWMVRHAAIIMNRFSVSPDGQTPYQALHGKRAPDRFVEFGEKVYYSIPKKMRHKLDPRWKLGVCVGVSSSSNEYYVSNGQGDIVKARSVVRVVSTRRWGATDVLNVRGIPGLLRVDGSEDPYEQIEQLVDPQAMLEADNLADKAVPEEQKKKAEAIEKQIRITMRDMRNYGFTDDCPRCEDLKKKLFQTNKKHSLLCRTRIYLRWEEARDPKFEAVKHLLPPSNTRDPAPEVDDAEIVRPPPSQIAQPPTEVATPIEPDADMDEDQAAKDWAWNHFNMESDDEGVGYNDADIPALIQEDDEEMREPVQQDTEAMVDALLIAGVDPNVAKSYARKFVCPVNSKSLKKKGKVDSSASFIEVFGSGNICRRANEVRRNLNLKGLAAMDLRTLREDGTQWDFCKKSHRREAREMVDRDEPTWVIGSPPCTSFCLWNVAMNYPKAKDKEKVREAIAAGKRHLNFVMSLYRKQLAAGRHFLHEHPASALSWRDDGVRALARNPVVHCVVAHQCMYGLTTPDGAGGELPALKPTRFMTSSKFMADRLSNRCDKSHKHQQLVGGRCAEAAYYPLGLIDAMLHGMRDTADFENNIKNRDRETRQCVSAVSSSAGEIPVLEKATTIPLTSEVPFTNGKMCQIVYDDNNFRLKYVDEYTGEVLEPSLIKAAIVDELNYFNSKVWQIEHVSDMYKEVDYVRTRSRWVVCNKGDDSAPDVRARLVSCEINKNKSDKPFEFYASTPPLEAQRIMFDRFASERYRVIDEKKVPLQMSFVDIRKAYFNGIPRRKVYMDLPKEMGLGKDYVARQVRCVYGTRDAGSIWEDCYRDALEGMGFTSGISSPCVFWHRERNISVVVHGDDFNALGVAEQLNWYEEQLKLHFEIKIRGRMGEGGDCNEIKILNRILRLTPSGLTYEADPRHVDLLASSMGLCEANKVSTPGTKDPVADYDAAKTEEVSFTGEFGHVDASSDNMVRPVICNMDVDEKHVRFNESLVETYNVPAYSEIYGAHPRTLKSTRAGLVRLSKSCNPYTAKSKKVMRSRNIKIWRSSKFAQNYRIRWIRHANEMLRNNDCKSSEIDTDMMDTDAPQVNRPPQKTEQTAARAEKSAFAEAREGAHRADQRQSCDHPMEIEPGLPLRSILKKLDRLAHSLDARPADLVCASRTPPAKKPGGAKTRQGTKKVKKMEKLLSEGHALSPEEATMFRALAARANYLSQDRTDTAFGSKELCREFAVPNKNSYARLKRLVRYLVGLPRLVYKFDYQELEETADVYTDTDFAGCKETRRSTSGGVIMIGGHTIRHWSRTQSTIALSSGEAELSGIGSGIAEALGFQSLAKDLGWHYRIVVHSDATAAIGIARRRGLGKVRHLDVTDLWVQEKIRSKAVELRKVAGASNPADILTKYVERPTLEAALKFMNLEKMEGRAATAPKAMGA